MARDCGIIGDYNWRLRDISHLQQSTGEECAPKDGAVGTSETNTVYPSLWGISAQAAQQQNNIIFQVEGQRVWWSAVNIVTQLMAWKFKAEGELVTITEKPN